LGFGTTSTLATPGASRCQKREVEGVKRET